MRSALTPNMDRLEIHPPVSTGPQWGQRNGAVPPGTRLRRASPPPPWAGFLSAGRHTGCAAPRPAFRAQRGFPGPVHGGDNHKLQGSD
jgi:hypothetical protein